MTTFLTAAVITLAAIGASVYLIKQRKKGGCTGCSGCTACGSGCAGCTFRPPQTPKSAARKPPIDKTGTE